MTMFRAGMAVAMVFIGGIAAFLGFVVLVSALSSGSLTVTYGAATEVATRTADPKRFAILVALLGAMPLIAGGLAARWGWRALRG